MSHNLMMQFCALRLARASPHGAAATRYAPSVRSARGRETARRDPLGRPRARKNRRDAAAEVTETPSDDDVVEDRLSETAARFSSCGEAIREGVSLFEQGRYAEALDAFNASLELPGEGRFRFAGRAKEFSGPSQSEEHSALYNMICCYSKLEEADSAVTCLEALLDADFEDYDTLRTDPDLANFRRDPRFEGTLREFTSVQKKVLKFLEKRSGPEKPWLL